MKVYSVVTVTFALLLVARGTDELDSSKLMELLSGSSESLEKERDSSQMPTDNEKEKNSTSLLPAAVKPEIDPAKSDDTKEEDVSKERAKKSYGPAYSLANSASDTSLLSVKQPFPLQQFPDHPYPAAHHISQVHSYIGKSGYGNAHAYLAPGPTYSSSHITYAAPHPAPLFSPVFANSPPYCVEVRPKVNTQTPLFLCEPSYEAVHQGDGVVTFPSNAFVQNPNPMSYGAYSASYARADEHQESTQSQQEQKSLEPKPSIPPQPLTTTPPQHQPPTPVTVTPTLTQAADHTTKPETVEPKAATDSPKEKSTEKPASTHGGSAISSGRSAYSAYSASSYSPAHVDFAGVYTPYSAPQPLPPAHAPIYPPVPPYPSSGMAHPYYAAHPLMLNCHVQPHYAGAPENPLAMLRLYMRPSGDFNWSSYREDSQPQQQKETMATEAPSTAAQSKHMNKAREGEPEMMMRALQEQHHMQHGFMAFPMRASVDQEPVSIGIPMPSKMKMVAAEEKCDESLPKMANPGGASRPVIQATTKRPGRGRMNYYMAVPDNMNMPVFPMRASVDQEPTSIAIPMLSNIKMIAAEEKYDESLPKMANPGGASRPVIQATTKRPGRGRMNYYMTVPGNINMPA